MELLSIIIPVYNVENYISQCIDSLLCQSDPYFEVILIDDGSKDNSGIICDNYAVSDGRIKVYHLENQGPSIARNFGISKAEGTLITFIDSDDWVSSEYVRTIKETISKYDLLFFCHCEYHVDKSYTIYKRPETFCTTRSDIDSFLLILKNSPQHIEYCNFTVNKCFRKSIIDSYNLKFPEELRTREDEIFTNCYLKYANSIRFIPDNLYVYRILNSGLTSKNKSQYQLITLAKYMMLSTEWQIGKLRCFSIRRAIDFFMEGSSICLFPSIKDYLYMYDKYNAYREKVPLRLVAKLSFSRLKIMGIFFYYILSSLKYIKRKL